MVACEARARFVARMDADDISHPDRLQGQLDIFRAHPEAGIVACLCNFVDPKGVKLRQCEHWRLSRRSVLAPFAHGTIMYRRELFDRVGGYREQCLFWEDQDLIARIADEAPVFVIPRPLYSYRLSSSSTRIASNQDQLEHSVNLMFRSVERLKRQEPYDDLLREFVADGRKVSPRVFVSLGSQLLWAGGRPRLFRRMLERAKLKFDLNTILSATWTAWASASPSTLRTFLRLLVGLRNIIAHAKHHSDDPVVWNSKPRLCTAALERHRQITLPASEEGLAIESGFICEIGPVANLAYSKRMASDAAA
jgi:glycosyltransferase involved in cell wall biosynthesis